MHISLTAKIANILPREYLDITQAIPGLKLFCIRLLLITQDHMFTNPQSNVKEYVKKSSLHQRCSIQLVIVASCYIPSSK